MASFEILRLRPIQIAVKDVGPFRTPEPVVIAFPGPLPDRASQAPMDGRNDHGKGPELSRPVRVPTAYERSRGLANLCFFHEGTGAGISTVLDCIYGLFDLMSSTGRQAGRAASRLGLRSGSEIQLDLLAKCVIEGRGIEAVASLWLGPTVPLLDWSPSLAAGEVWGATEWITVGFDSLDHRPNEGTNWLGWQLLKAVRGAEGAAAVDAEASGSDCPATTRARHRLPTALRFGRGLLERGEGYTPARGLSLETYLGADFDRAVSAMSEGDRVRVLDWISDGVLIDAGAEPPRFHWSTDGSGLLLSYRGELHPASLLDASERSLLALHVAVFLHGTEATLVLIDGIDGYFVPDDYHYLHRSLTVLIERERETTVMVAARSAASFMSFVEHPFDDPIVVGGARMAGV